MSTPILVYNRLTGALETEKVYGRRWMELCYGNAMGRRIGAALLARRPVSAAYGRLQQRSSSRRKIPAFIDQYDIDLDQVVVPPGGFASFNDFFIRRLKPQARPVDPDPFTFISPADSRLTVLDLHGDTPIRVKGMALHLPGLLGLPPHRTPWDGGTVLVFRLAPCDYHRFGHAVDGVQGAVHSVEGPFHSVNPLAMAHKPDTLMTNFRQWCLVYSPQWGTILQVEVGAMMVGSIVQQMPRGGPCRRGQEKGYFQFGGSTVVVVLEPDRIAVDNDIREQSSKGIETLVQYGEAVGTFTSA
jgi:phosphatidylserine decarboxylase